MVLLGSISDVAQQGLQAPGMMAEASIQLITEGGTGTSTVSPPSFGSVPTISLENIVQEIMGNSVLQADPLPNHGCILVPICSIK